MGIRKNQKFILTVIVIVAAATLGFAAWLVITYSSRMK
jgi:multidrug resistance efflux pump